MYSEGEIPLYRVVCALKVKYLSIEYVYSEGEIPLYRVGVHSEGEIPSIE